MAYILSYRKSITRDTTKMLNAPEGSTELCTIDGITYVSIPSGAAIDSDQHAEVIGTMEVVTPDLELSEKIKAASPHVALIDKRVCERIAESYSLTEEIKLLRTSPSPEFEAYNDYAEQCRQWGRDQKAALGLFNQASAL